MINHKDLLDDYSEEAALLLSEMFHKRYDLWRTSHLSSPVVHDVSVMQLPKRSTYHYVDMEGIRTGPEYSDVIFANIPGKKAIRHVKKFFRPEGRPIKVSGVNIETLISAYRRSNRLIRPILDTAQFERDERGVLIFNYSTLIQEWRYTANFRAEHTKFDNLYRTMIHSIKGQVKDSTRHQYMDVFIPDRVPRLDMVRAYARSKSTDSIKYLADSESYLIAELFTWLSEDQDKSIFNVFKEDELQYINLILRKDTTWVTVNLSWLNAFRVDGGLTPKSLSTKFLLLISRVLEVSATLADERPETSEEPTESTKLPDELDELASIGKFGDDTELPDETEDLDEVTQLIQAEKELEEIATIQAQSLADTGEDDETKEISRYEIDGFDNGGAGTAFINKVEQLAQRNNINTNQYKRLMRIVERANDLPDPYGSDKLLVDAMEVTHDDIVLKPSEFTNDEHVPEDMRKSTTDAFREQYIDKLYKKDMMSSLMAVQNFPVAVTGYKVKDISDAMNEMEEHHIRIVPAVGEPTTLVFPTPKLSKDGTFKYSGTRYHMRNQRADNPLRKIGPADVVISAYAAKCFVSRSTLSRFNTGKWIRSFLVAEATNSETTVFQNPSLSRVVVYDTPLPWMYTTIATELASFEVDGVKYNFDYKRRKEVLGLTDEDLKYEKKGQVIVAKSKKGLVVMQTNNELVLVKDGEEDVFTDFETMLGMDRGKAPLPMAEVRIYSKRIPIGVVLGYLLGLDQVLKLTKAKVRRANPGERLNLETYEYAIRFRNEVLILDSRDRYTTLVMSGWRHIESVTKQFNVDSFNTREVYGPALGRAGINDRYLKELDTMNTGFLDPMTKQYLRDMGEPDEFAPLLLRATELILDEYVPSKRKDPKGEIELNDRIRGYERIPGFAYEIIYKAMRSYAARANRSDAKVVINPRDLMNAIISDPTTSPINQINPVQTTKEREFVTTSGRGGMSKRAMTAAKRLYKEEDKGFISEGTVDSGDVGVITYLAPNANITTLRGSVRLFDEKKDSTTSLLSTSSQLAFSADGDTPKRMGFISIQLAHQIATQRMDVSPARTGAERGLIGRMPDNYGKVAQQPGKVLEVNDTHITVEYKDGTQESYPIGDVTVTAEGTYYTHHLSALPKAGESFEKGDVLYYEDNFFKPSPLNPKQVDYSFGLLTYTAFRESNYTIEDSCGIMDHWAKDMTTAVVKPQSKIVKGDQEVINLLPVGTEVDLDTVLLQVVDPELSDASPDELSDALARFDQYSVRSEVVGTISDRTIYYNGDPELFSESLQKLIREQETRRKKAAKLEQREYYPNKVDKFSRIGKYSVDAGEVLIVNNVTVSLGMGVSDKLVTANQLKSTVGKVLFGTNTNLQGRRLDMIFGALSGVNRTVLSLYKSGGVNSFLTYVGEEAYRLYNS